MVNHYESGTETRLLNDQTRRLTDSVNMSLSGTKQQILRYKYH